MKRSTKWAAVAVVVIFLLIQFDQPMRTNPVSDPALAMQTELRVPPDVAATLQRACDDCHSNQTRWPWYSYVAPTSWFVADHVNSGRYFINFSNWVRPGKEPIDSEDRLKAMCEEVKSGGMPLSSYLLIHWNAKLSVGDVSLICNWTDQERQRLAASAPAGAKNPNP